MSRAAQHEPPTKKRREEVHVNRCEALVNKLWTADTLGMFHKPVTDAEAPGYFSMITSPMDLATIRMKLRTSQYQTTREVVSDVRLMFSNALEFNEKGDAWYTHAKKMLSGLNSLLEECGLKKYDEEKDSDDEAFVPDGRIEDREKAMAKDEKKAKENVGELLQTLEDDLNVPLEVLRARYQRPAAAAAVVVANVSSDDDEDDDDEEEDEDDSTSDSSDSDEEEEDEDDASDEEDESEESSGKGR